MLHVVSLFFPLFHEMEAGQCTEAFSVKTFLSKDTIKLRIFPLASDVPS